MPTATVTCRSERPAATARSTAAVASAMLVRLTARQILSLARTPLGRRRITNAALPRLAPLLRQWALLHRRTLARRVRVVAVTGSFGKSTTVRLTEAVLGLPGLAAGLEIPNGVWSVPRRMVQLAPGQRHAVIEIGIDRAGLMARQAQAVAPDIAIVTSVGGEHLETMGDLDTIQREKARLLAGLRPGGVTVLNGDDPRVRAMAHLAPGEVLTYGLGPGNDVRAVDLAVDWPHGTRFTASVRGDQVSVSLPLLGRHMVPPALAALAVAAIEGVSLTEAAAAIGAMPPGGARLEVVALADGTTLLCDHHKNSIETIRAALELAAELPGRKLLVITRMRFMTGELEPALQMAAKLLARVVDEMIVIGDGVKGSGRGGGGGRTGTHSDPPGGARGCRRAARAAGAVAAGRRDPAEGQARGEARPAGPGTAGSASGLRPRKLRPDRPALCGLPDAGSRLRRSGQLWLNRRASGIVAKRTVRT